MQESISYRMSSDGVAVVELDLPGKPVNVLSTPAMEIIAELIAELRQAPELRGVVLSSGKPSGFIAGADIDEIAAIADAGEGERKAARGQQILAALADIDVPVVAAISGACLGGGTELALACDYRVASDEAGTRIGLPEVNLGILPGFGGTQRLPRLIGIQPALEMILGGKPVNAARAARLGLVDRVVPRERLIEEAVRWASERPKRPRRGRAVPPGLASRLLEGTSLGRRLLFRQAHKRLMGRTSGFYPAPLIALEAIRRGISMSLDEGLALEARLLGELVVGDVCRNLVWLFQASSAAKTRSVWDSSRRSIVGDARATGSREHLSESQHGTPPSPPRKVERLAVIGAGVMGSGIAQLASYHDLSVTLKDVDQAALERGSETIRRLYQSAVKKGKLSPARAYAKTALISATTVAEDLAGADVAIEAAVEDMAVKQSILRELEGVTGGAAIFATNTSSLSVTELARAAVHPEKVAGMHFFNPVHRMPLVEIVAGELTSEETVASLVGLATSLGKVPIVVADSPGFVVNRILGPYLNEACLLLEEGNGIERIDAALTSFGMPMGPFRLLDEIGLDVASKVQSILRDAYPQTEVSGVLDVVVETGRLGRKNGRGFYLHRGGKARVDREVEGLFSGGTPTSPATAVEIRDRTVYAMLNEAAHIVEQGIVGGVDDVDLAMVVGAGFPPFRGGLFRSAEREGIGKVVARLEDMAVRYGPRFAPAALLQRRAERTTEDATSRS